MCLIYTNSSNSYNANIMPIMSRKDCNGDSPLTIFQHQTTLCALLI